jgi:branched-subunit amino acid transport protein
MNEIWLIAGMALITYAIRAILFPVSKHVSFPPLLEQSLRYVPPVVLTAIIVPAICMPDGQNLQLNLDNPHLVGALAAGLTCFISRNLLLTIVTGMSVFWMWQWLIN